LYRLSHTRCGIRSKSSRDFTLELFHRYTSSLAARRSAILEAPSLCSPQHICSGSEFQDHGNKIYSHPALSVFVANGNTMPVDASATHTVHFAQDIAVEIAAAGQRAVGHVLEFAGGCAKPPEVDAGRRLLLSLFQSKAPGKLREDVRDAEIRVALVGDVVREIAKPSQRR
jgi:hypothetical protein